MSFRQIIYRVADPARAEAFYRDILGMWDGVDGLGFGDAGARLRFMAGDVEHHKPGPDKAYWKIGITLRNLDHAVAYLCRAGVEVSTPRQFCDIGYLAHLTDPAGHVIELLQVGFEGREGEAGTGHPVGGQATLAHITLRTTNLAASQDWAKEEMGLRLMSVQPVPDFGFTLYFYAWSAEVPPDPDLAAVENREWLWARPYTLLEFQHLEGRSDTLLPTGGGAGPTAILCEVGDQRRTVSLCARL